MKKLKKYFVSFINNENNIRTKLNISFFITALFLFSLFILNSNNHSFQVKTIEVISAIYFVLWLMTTSNYDMTYDMIKEFLKVIFFFGCIVFSLYFWLNAVLVDYNQPILFLLLAFTYSIVTLLCVYYITDKFFTIVSTVKTMFNKLNTKLIDYVSNNEGKPTLLKRVIINVTAFLVALGGLAASIATITSTITSIYSNFKPPQ